MELEQSKKDNNIIERTLGSFGLFEGDLLKGLSMSLQMTYTYLLYHYNHKTKKCCPSIRRLAKEMGCNKETVSIAIEKLQSIGLIIKHHIHGKKSSYDLPFVRIKLYGNKVQLEENCTEIVPTSNTNCTEIVPTTVRKSGTVYPQTVRKSCPEQDVYKDVYKTTTTNYQKSESSSSSFFESNKEKEVPVYLLETIGFTIGHVSQIASKGILTIEEIIESIKAYSNFLNFDSKKAKAIKDPLAYFMGILKNGNTYLLPESTKKVMTKKAISPKKPLTEEERRKYENEAFRRTKAELLGNS